MKFPPQAWSLISFGCKFFILAALLWVNSSDFDETELKTLVAFLITSGGIDFTKARTTGSDV